MYMKYIFLCEGGMHLLITGFARIGYLHGKGRLGIWVCLQFVIVVFPDHTRLLFLCLCCWQCKTKIVWKRVWQSFTSFVMSQLSCLASPHRAVGVIVAVPGRTHLLFKLTFSIQFLKVGWQEEQNFLWWRPLSYAWVLRGFLTMDQTQK